MPHATLMTAEPTDLDSLDPSRPPAFQRGNLDFEVKFKTKPHMDVVTDNRPGEIVAEVVEPPPGGQPAQSYVCLLVTEPSPVRVLRVERIEAKPPLNAGDTVKIHVKPL